MRTKTKKKFSSFSKWAILHRKMAHSARQNDSFEEVKWAVLKCKTAHFASDKNVKKIQVLCFPRFRKLSYFAYLRPQDFNFRIIESQSTFFDILSKEFSISLTVRFGRSAVWSFVRFCRFVVYEKSNGPSETVCVRVSEGPLR